MFGWLTQRSEWQLFAALPRASGRLALLWWAVVVLHGTLPALFAVAMGVLVSQVQQGAPLIAPLAVIGVIFILCKC